MALAESEFLHTAVEYLVSERASGERHEYLDGRIYAMAGESEEHGIVCVNLVGELRNQLRASPCQVFTNNMKVRSGPVPPHGHLTKGLFSYPDVLVVCGERQYHDQFRDVLLNPTVIVEVLSPATEAFDRGQKFFRYRTWLESLTDYLLVSQTEPFIDHYSRQMDEGWLLSTVTGLDGLLNISSVDCTLRLSDIYERVVFQPESPEELVEHQP
jgi:Uma2 family endonuclease